MEEFFIEIDGVSVPFFEGETIVKCAARKSIEVPILCGRKEHSHRAGCMVCAMFDLTRNAFIPACETIAQVGMKLENASPRVREFRKKILELLLAEHKGDCVAPCRKACPYDFDIPRFLEAVSSGDSERISRALSVMPDCANCKGLCEKVCRRQLVDKPVKIISTIKKFAEANVPILPKKTKSKKYVHSFGKPTAQDLKIMAETSDDVNGCLQCHCKKEDDCVLRELATAFEIAQPAALGARSFERVKANGVIFESGKCVLCASCVECGGLALSGRGKTAHISNPVGSAWEDSLLPCHIKACPTGAISKDSLKGSPNA